MAMSFIPANDEITLIFARHSQGEISLVDAFSSFTVDENPGFLAEAMERRLVEFGTTALRMARTTNNGEGDLLLFLIWAQESGSAWVVDGWDDDTRESNLEGFQDALVDAQTTYGEENVQVQEISVSYAKVIALFEDLPEV